MSEETEAKEGVQSHDAVIETKQMRVDGDAIIQNIKGSPRQSAERTLALRRFQEGVMWLGMDLKAQKEAGEAPGMANPYPNSYDTSNRTIEPTADGLKM